MKNVSDIIGDEFIRRHKDEDCFNYKVRVTKLEQLKTLHIISKAGLNIKELIELNDASTTNDTMVKKHLNGQMFPVKSTEELLALKERVAKRAEKLKELIRQAQLNKSLKD